MIRILLLILKFYRFTILELELIKENLFDLVFSPKKPKKEKHHGP